MEPIHPTYGTLAEFMAQVASTIRRGEYVRIGHHGAMAWFSREYADLNRNPAPSAQPEQSHKEE